MSALPPKADMCGATAHVCFGPKADIQQANLLTANGAAIANFLDIFERPTLVKKRLGWRVEAEVEEVTFAGQRLNPVLLETFRSCWAEVHIHRAVRVLHYVRLTRRHICILRVVDDHLARRLIIDCDGPELLNRRIGRNVQAVCLAARQPLAILVLIGGDISLTDTRRLGEHCIRDRDGLVEKRGAFVQCVLGQNAGSTRLSEVLALAIASPITAASARMRFCRISGLNGFPFSIPSNRSCASIKRSRSSTGS